QQSYLHLFQSLLLQPAAPLASLSCLPPAERTRLLHDWNATSLVCPPAADQCIQHLFEAQVERTPQAIALSDGSQRFTYQQLNCRANQLAHYLRRVGIGPEQLVGLCLPRSLDLVIGMLAILKAGAAYVP